MEPDTPHEAPSTEEEQYRLLVGAITDYAIYMIDPDGRVISWNAGAERFKGYEASEIIGRHFSMFYSEEDRQTGIPGRALSTAAREGRFESEGWRIRKDGTRFWAHVIIDPVLDPTGALVGFAKITRDVTEKMETQRALEKAREAFFHAQKMEAIGRLTGGVAHDFNNLLTAILGSLQLVRKRILDNPKNVLLVDNAVDAAKRGAMLTQRMLAFARQQELTIEPTDLTRLVPGMRSLFERVLDPSFEIELRIPLTLKLVQADANQLELALLNLVTNARDAMPEGGKIIISARTERIGPNHDALLPPGDYVCLSVTDNGEGMDESALVHASEPFFTTKGVGKGTGLGLSMVQGLMEQLGGRLVLKSELGLGTTAELHLSIAASLPDVLKPAVDAKFEKYARPLSILAVDDDILVLLNTVAMLEDLGHSVIQAPTGKAALAVLRSESVVDLLLADQAMPHMTGMQLASLARQDRPLLPIILATGYAELPDQGHIGLVRLSKPYMQEDLARVIAEVMKSQAA